MTTNPQDHYIADLRELERDVNGMTYKVSELDPDHKAKARAEGKWLVVSLSDRPKLGWVRSGIAYDPETDSYCAVCHASVGVAPRRFQSFKPAALEFARTGSAGGGKPVGEASTTTSSDPTGGSRVRSVDQDLSSGDGPLTSEGALFDSLIERIERAYIDLNHRLGWRFLYSPRRTLAAPGRLLFVGMNPGGSAYVRPIPSVEVGNAYRTETDWGARGAGHQIQVCRLYEGLARRLERDDVELLMDETLVSNFCPFRSPSWPVPNRGRSVAFSHELWRDVWRHLVRHVERPVMICNGKRAFGYFRTVVEGQGARLIGQPELGSIGWGDQTYGLAQYDTAMLVTLPHLSRYAIVGRHESQQAVDRIISTVAGALRG